MNATHTPGPWIVRAGHFCSDGVPAYEVVMNGTRTVNSADASLIAAAPDMLAELKSVEQLITNDSDDLGFHLHVVPISVDRVRAIRGLIAQIDGVRP